MIHLYRAKREKLESNIKRQYLYEYAFIVMIERIDDEEEVCSSSFREIEVSHACRKYV